MLRKLLLTVTSPCLTDTLTISFPKFTSQVLQYNIGDSAYVLSWTDADATSDQNLTNCGMLTWTVTKTDGSPHDPTIFTIDLAAKTIGVYTTDLSKAATYTL